MRVFLYGLIKNTWMYFTGRFCRLSSYKNQQNCLHFHKSSHIKNVALTQIKNRKKPNWVKHEVIRLKAIQPDLSCRLISQIFNAQSHGTRLSKHDETISKSYVAYVIKQNAYEISQQRKHWKTRPVHQVAFQNTWGMDLSFVNQQPLLGIVEHHSRRCLAMMSLRQKTTLAILQQLLNTIEQYGIPNSIRTDNEACFNAKLMRFCLWCLGIKKQTTQPHSPWQNGRIERFFGTFKRCIKTLPVRYQTPEELPYLLQSFQWWYNHIRLHQNLDYQTPAEVFNQALNQQRQKARKRRRR